MKFYIRRLVFGAVTAPFIGTAYGLFYILLSALSPVNHPDWSLLIGNAEIVAVTYVATLVFWPNLLKLVNRLFQ